MLRNDNSLISLSTILTEKGLDKNMIIKPELTGNRVLERLKFKKYLDSR